MNILLFSRIPSSHIDLESGLPYHIYNRGNNREQIFIKRDNYLYFLQKVRTHFLPHVDILAYCLMPNHFHFMVQTKTEFKASAFGHDLKVMLRSYTRAINNQQNRSGSLFQQNTSRKLLLEDSSKIQTDNYGLICFHYIHQNPLRAGLVSLIEEWEFSSFRDYAGLRQGTLCNRALAAELLAIPIDHDIFNKVSMEAIDEDKLRGIFETK